MKKKPTEESNKTVMKHGFSTEKLLNTFIIHQSDLHLQTDIKNKYEATITQ